jgi:transposase
MDDKIITLIIEEINNCKAFNKSFNNYKNKLKKYDLKLIINEIYYILKTGLSWRNYRGPINYNTLFYYNNKLAKERIFEKAYIKLLNDYYKTNKQSKIKYQLIDTTFIRNKLGSENISLNKFYRNKKCSKISLLTDELGIPISIIYDKGSKADISFTKENINKTLIKINTKKYMNNNKFKQILLADKGYTSKQLKEDLNKEGYIIIVPPKKNSKNIFEIKDKIIYKKRMKIEQIFSRLKQSRRIDTRYERKTINYISFVYASLIKIVSNIIKANY